MAELSDALHDPGRYGEKFISGRVSAVVPSVVGQAAKAMDPSMREIHGIVDAIKARIPRVRETLYPKRNLYGESIDLEGGFWMRYLSPSVPSHESATPGERAIVESAADIGAINRTIHLGNKIVRLDDAQYDTLQVVSGPVVKQLVEGVASSPGFASLTKEQRANLLRQQVKQGREIGRTLFIAKERLFETQ